MKIYKVTWGYVALYGSLQTWGKTRLEVIKDMLKIISRVAGERSTA